MASIHDDWLSEKAHLMQAEYNYKFVCPECGKDGFSVQKTGNKLLYHCFKAGCGFSGRILLTGHSSLASQAQAVPQEERLTPYTGELYPLDDRQRAALQYKFELSARAVDKVFTNGTHYLIPINSYDGVRRGMVERRPWEGTEWKGCANEFGIKSRIYKERSEPMLDWWACGMATARAPFVVLVEDQLSAMKLCDRNDGTPTEACALLGTSLNSEKVSEIQSVSKHIVIALDSDATATAFKLARKWQSAFSSCRVVILERDCKDMSREELNEKFG